MIIDLISILIKLQKSLSLMIQVCMIFILKLTLRYYYDKLMAFNFY